MSNTSLYPPIVASSMPAFNIDETNPQVKVYFQFSKYNDQNDIGSIQVSVRRRDNNKNVLKKDYSEAVEKQWYTDEKGHYIIIYDRNLQDLKNDKTKTGFIANTVYKVQLRFSSTTRSDAGYGPDEDPEHNTYYSYLINQTDKFSEWSSVCLITPVHAPKISIVDIDDYGEWEVKTGRQRNQKKYYGNNANQNYYYNNLADFVFTYSQKNGKYKSQEILKQWKAELYKVSVDNQILVAEQDWTSVVNLTYQTINQVYSIPCSLPYEFEDESVYRIIFRIRTTNGYQNQCDYYFTAKLDLINNWADYDYGDYKSSLNTYINEQQGYVKIVFEEGANKKIRNLILRRANSKDNFQRWETIRNYAAIETIDPSEYPNVRPGFIYHDFTIESGIAYRYLVQEKDNRGRRYTPLYDQFGRQEIDGESHRYDSSAQYGIMGEWDSAFLLQSQGYGLIDQIKQLKLKYNFSLSSLSVNLAESKTDTLGSQYPFIKRNASTYYRSFPVSGTIAASMDNAKLFTSKEILNNGYSHIYDDFKGNINTGFSKQYDYTYERKFRQAVMEFLYDSKPKLFKTMQQGNILIRLMEVSLSPVEGLNRLVYNFSATAYEIGETDIENLEKCGIINTGVYDNSKEFDHAFYGQLHYLSEDGSDFKAYRGIIGVMPSEDFRNSITIAKQIGYGIEKNNSIITDFRIKWLRITFESNPYSIVYGDDPATENEITEYYPMRGSQNLLTDSQLPYYQMGKDDYYIGHVLRVFNGTMSSSSAEDIIIAPPNNIYEIGESENGVTIQANSFEIWPKKDSNLIVDYIVEASVQPIVNKPIAKIRTSKEIGQFYGSYDYTYDFIDKINIKYTNDYQGSTRRLEKINSIHIEAQPETVFELGMNGEVNYIIMDQTGILDLKLSDNDDIFNSLKVCGFHINQYVDNVILIQGGVLARYKNKIYTVKRAPLTAILGNGNYILDKQVIGTSEFYLSRDVDITYIVTTRREYK